jgi:hypothetical protein
VLPGWVLRTASRGRKTKGWTRERIAAGQEVPRLWLAELFRTLGRTNSSRSGTAVGSFYLALLNGLMVQWLLDPGRAPTGPDVAAALREIMIDFQKTNPSR